MSNVLGQWQQYQQPGMAPVGGVNGNFNFFRPDNSQLPTGAALGNYLTNNGQATPDQTTNRTVKYDGGLTREMLGNTTNFLNTQLGRGFTGVEEMFNRYGSLGGLGGVAQTGNASSVYRPGGQVMATNQAQPWGSTNPFNATF